MLVSPLQVSFSRPHHAILCSSTGPTMGHLLIWALLGQKACCGASREQRLGRSTAAPGGAELEGWGLGAAPQDHLLQGAAQGCCSQKSATLSEPPYSFLIASVYVFAAVMKAFCSITATKGIIFLKILRLCTWDFLTCQDHRDRLSFWRLWDTGILGKAVKVLQMFRDFPYQEF